jgi:alginate O-acetyltransferase complex protein AlgI
MLFPTVAFAVFFLTAFAANWLLRPHFLVWRATMIALSLYFYGWVDVRFVFVLVASAAVNSALAVAVRRAMPGGEPTAASRTLVRVAVAANLAVLGVFRYHGFFADSLGDALGSVGLHPSGPALDLLVPIGLAFLTLHAISYVVDVGRGDIEPVAFADVLLYMSFFPHVVAGPIVRVDEVVPQFHDRPDPRRVAATEAFALIGLGLVKVVVVSSYLGREIVDPAFADPGSRGGAELAVAAWAFAVQVYADFSGYTDIALGCALLLGVRLPANFASPYRALSVREFWHRWHMTLARWLRDYVYLPLGGDRKGTTTTYRNLAVTMLLAGLWHGPAWTFVVWGGLHGAYLVGERGASAWYTRRPGLPAPPPAVTVVVRWLLTFNLVTLAWVFFRADSVGTGLEVVGRIATAAAGSTGLVTALVLAVVAGSLALQVVPARRTGALRAWFSALRPLAQAAVLAAVLTVVGVLGPDGAASFLHYRL